MRLDLDNAPQPAARLRIMSAAGGQSGDSADDSVEGAPEFVAEVASSSEELCDGEYASLPLEDETMKSRVFPGLWLEVEALVSGQSARVLAQLSELAPSESSAPF